MAHTNFRNLTDEQVREITELWDDGGGCTKAELAEAYGVSVVTINRVLGRRWSSTIDQEAIDQFSVDVTGRVHLGVL